MKTELDFYYERLKFISNLSSASSLLQWDQEIHLPPFAHEGRASQISCLSGLLHEQFLDPAFIRCVSELQEKSDLLDDRTKRSIKRTFDSIQRKQKLSKSFIEKLSKQTSLTLDAWMKASKKNSYEEYAPELTKLIDLKRQEAQLLQEGGTLYETLMEEFEPGMTEAKLDLLFKDLRLGIQPLLKLISASEQPRHEFMQKRFANDKQLAIGLELMKACGFDENRSRQDISKHPFTITLGKDDVRITTRINENNLNEMLWSSLHEMGHAFYELGLQHGPEGSPETEACSLSIHESQSRYWENHIGRSRVFTDELFVMLKANFKENMEGISADDLYRAVNKVQPDFIRTSADELTYHSHVSIRYRIEKALMNGEINASDAKSMWNELYEDELGLIVKDDRSGILQDIHWAHGSFGYFPTYTLGSLYAAQFAFHIDKVNPALTKTFSKANYSDIKNWLNQTIYQAGKLFDSEELCKIVTGEFLDARYFLAYTTNKYHEIYKISN